MCLKSQAICLVNGCGLDSIVPAVNTNNHSPKIGVPAKQRMIYVTGRRYRVFSSSKSSIKQLVFFLVVEIIVVELSHNFVHMR